MWNVDFKIGKSDNCAGGINMLIICNSYLCLYYKLWRAKDNNLSKKVRIHEPTVMWMNE